MTTPAPKVSVAVITYNHAPYIRQALESIIAQRTNFPYEVVIGEDCSTDTTRVIVQDFALRYTDIIRLLLHENNVGAVRNFMFTVSACTGQYLAILEGDDYWNSADKLQQQVDFLEKNPEYAFCFTGSSALDEEKGQIDGEIRPNVEKPQYELCDLLGREFFPSGSVMFRRDLVPSFPAWFSSISADFILTYEILFAQHGPIGRIDEPMSVYRRHSGGLWTGAEYLQRLRWNAQSFDLIDRCFRYRRSRDIHITERFYKLAAATNDTLEARHYLRKALSSYSRDPSISLRKLIVLTVQIYTPTILRYLVGIRSILFRKTAR